MEQCRPVSNETGISSRERRSLVVLVLILTHILQKEVTGEMDALKQSVQREPALPYGVPTGRAIVTTSQVAPRRVTSVQKVPGVIAF